jgi:uncharacterized protein (DUF433 family)
MNLYNGVMIQELVLEQHIVAAPGIRSGKPRLDGTRITVADVVIMHLRLGQSLEEIAGEYDLSLAAVHAAMSYYYDHRDEIETSIAESQRYAEEMSKSTKSLLQEKLTAARV